MKKQTQNIVLAGMFLALGLVLPFLTGQIQVIGSMLLPMHIPVLLCGLICGWQYGLGVGLILPLLRHVMFGMPAVPMCFSMALELGAYGFISGYMYSHAKWKCIRTLMISLVSAMIGGRIVWALAQMVIFGIQGGSFTWQMFLAGALLNAIPGIILQLVLIPLIMVALNRAKIRTFDEKECSEAKS